MNPAQQWRKIGETPLFPCIEDDVWDRHPSAPHVLRIGDKLRMYYHGRQGELIRIGFAEASLEDPFAWKKYPDNPVLDLGPEGAIDSHWAAYPWVVPITHTHWHLYYATFGGEYHDEAKTFKIWRTSLAESDDAGITWQRTGSPLFELERPGAPDEHGTGSCCVRKVGDEYWMWYTALYRPCSDWYRISVALAISTDGGHTFTPHPAGALLNIPPRIGNPGSTCSKPFVEHDDDIFRMWFSCAKDRQLYRVNYAESQDGIHFKWHPEPVLDVSASGWDQEMTCYPSVLRTVPDGPVRCLGERTLMFYDGNSYANIGVAELVEA